MSVKYHVWQKYFIGFLTVAVLVLLFVNVFGYYYQRNRLLERQKQILYQEVRLISDEYQEDYVENGVSREAFVQQLRMAAVLLDARIWLTDRTGTLLADTADDGSVAPAVGGEQADGERADGAQEEPAAGVNLAELQTGLLEQVYVEDLELKALTDEPMLAVVEPMLSGIQLRGYLIFAQPMGRVLAEVDRLMFLSNMIAGLVLLCFAGLLSWFAYYHESNLRRLRKAAVAYADGDFSYEMKPGANDAYRELGNSIHYLAEQHANLVNYQKNFIANISHDFRSPLTSIKGYAEAMKDGTIPYEIQGKYLDIILFETDRLSNLTNDLLDLSNFENKGVRLECSKFDITKMLKQSAMTFEGKCSQKNLRIRLIFAENEMMVYADRGKIQQVVHNLIDNAIKFSHTDSTIEVTVMEQREKILVSVKDHGIGIPKESISKVWERFYKTDLSRGKDKKGTGLGLSITKQIIAAHNENIKVVSTEGVGTEFIFSLAKAE